MTYLDKTFGARVAAQETGSGTGQSSRVALVLLVEDDFTLSDVFRSVCECLNVAVERIPTRNDLGSVLRRRRPMAVVAEMDAAGQDGCNVLMTVAAYDRDLPVMLIAGDDPALLGAIDAVEEIWHLSSVDKWTQEPNIGAVVDFIFRAGRKGSCMRLMST
jgi:DNA-binding NtrC family response regulator